jgi:hypothetical protein
MGFRHQDQERHAVQVVTGVCLFLTIVMLAGVPVLVDFFQF